MISTQLQDPNLEILVQELQRKYLCHTLILYGSRARGDAKETSDYDLMGITEKGNDIIRDARIWNGFYLDAFVYSESKITAPDEDLLRLRGGIILIERDGIGTQLLQKLEKIYLVGPKPLPSDEIQVRRMWARKMLERARFEDIEGNFRRHWLLTVLIEDYFLIRGWWYRGPKESFTWLKSNQPKLFSLYEKALRPGAALETLAELVSEIDKDISLALRKVNVEDYNPEWPKQFEKIKLKIWPLICDFAVAIEHVGSTSIPGLAAKPIIDIDIVISSESHLGEVISRLQSLGYEHRGNMGIEGREAFKAPEKETEERIPHNLYVCLSGCLAMKNHLNFRDYLRNHPSERDAYAKIKKELAFKFPESIDSYVDGKTEFVVKVLKNLGMGEDDLNAINTINKLPHKR